MSETNTTPTPQAEDDTQAANQKAAEDQVEKPKTKKAKTDKTGQSSSTPKPKPKKAEDSTQSTQSTQPPKAKRGPARPHRRLAAEVIETRITKLQKRLDRAKSQIEDAARHVEGYLRERDFRAKEASTEIQVAA